MGRTQNRGAADPLADDLRWYFCHSEAELGMQSSFGAFVDMAMSGIQSGGRSNGVERRAAAIASRLSRPAQSHRETRRRLQALGAREPRLVDALFAAYGTTDWVRVADAAFGRGTGERLARALGAEQIGVALLTERLARAHADWAGPPVEVIADGSRWLLEEDAGGSEALYRCAGPLVSSHRSERPAESDGAVRKRAIRAVGGRPLRAEHAALYDATGAELDAAVKVADVDVARRAAQVVVQAFLPRRRLVAPAPAPAASPGAVLRALVVAAYPQRLPKTAAQKLAMGAAMVQVNAIRNEAAVLLQRARAALPAAEKRRAARAAGPRRQAGDTLIPPALRRKSRPIVVYSEPADLLIGPGGL